MSLRQKLALFWPRIDRFWKILARYATLIVFVAFFYFLKHIIKLSDVFGWLSSVINAVGAGLVVFFESFWDVITLFDGAEWLSMWLSFVISMALLCSVLLIYMENLDDKKPTQPFKLRQLVFPKKFYSPKMWVTDTPYTAVFIFFVALWLVFYGWYFGQFNLSPREIFIACLTLVLLGAVYVFCVLAQGYRDFFNNYEPALEEVRKQHTLLSSRIDIFWRFLVWATTVTVVSVLVVVILVTIYYQVF